MGKVDETLINHSVVIHTIELFEGDLEVPLHWNPGDCGLYFLKKYISGCKK